MTARTPLLAGNWKMHRTASEAAHLVSTLTERLVDVTDRDVLIAPPFPAAVLWLNRLFATEN